MVEDGERREVVVVPFDVGVVADSVVVFAFSGVGEHIVGFPDEFELGLRVRPAVDVRMVLTYAATVGLLEVSLRGVVGRPEYSVEIRRHQSTIHSSTPYFTVLQS